MEITWSKRLTKSAGICYSIRSKKSDVRKSRIVLSTKLIISGDRLRDTMANELCHAAYWILSKCKGGHGPLWKIWTQKVSSITENRNMSQLPYQELNVDLSLRSVYKKLDSTILFNIPFTIETPIGEIITFHIVMIKIKIAGHTIGVNGFYYILLIVTASICYNLPLSVTIYHYLSVFIITCHYLLLSVTTCYYLQQFIAIFNI